MRSRASADAGRRRWPGFRPADESGIALLVALGILLALTIALVATMELTGAGGRHASRSNASQTAYALAESGISNAIAVLSSGTEVQAGTGNDAADPDFLPARTNTDSTGSVTWSGTLSGSTWTLTSTASVANPTGAGGAPVRRQITRTATISVATSPQLFDALYNENRDPQSTGCSGITGLKLNNTDIRPPLMTKGDVCLSGTSKLLGSRVAIEGTLALATANNSVGTPSAHVTAADIGGGCKDFVSPVTTHAVCNGPPTYDDRVYAGSVTANPTIPARPVYDFPSEYDNAAPGPKHPCDATLGSTSTPWAFDVDTSYDGDSTLIDITPSTSYTCRAKDAGGNTGELSWDASAKVLTIAGSIFFDGNLDVTKLSTISTPIHYYGHGTIFFSEPSQGKFSGETWCAGGTAGADCAASPVATTMAGWTPYNSVTAPSGSTLSLVFAGYGGVAGDVDLNFPGGAYQGVIDAVNTCHVHGSSAYVSGPLICGELDTDGVGVFLFPAVELQVGGGGASTVTLTVNDDQSG